MSVRRSHTKSRTGCLQCKRRHKKCDERRPGCENCYSYGVVCTYPENIAPSTASSTEESSYQSSFEQFTAHLRPNEGTPPKTPESIAATGLPELNMSDLELLYHFTLHASQATFPWCPQTWQGPVVGLGFKHPFLMHGILAVSAVHLHWLNGRRVQSYLTQAASHQDAGLQGFRKAVENLDDTNFAPALAFSNLILQFDIGGPKDATDRIDALVDSMELFRGVVPILMPRLQALENTDLYPIVNNEVITMFPRTANRPEITKLRSFLDADFTAQHPALASAYLQAQDQLEQVSALDYHARRAGATGIPALTMFYAMVQREFVQALREREPRALIIIAHQVAQLHYYRNDLWTMDDFALPIVARIDEVLDERWRGWMEWPKETVGLGKAPIIVSESSMEE